MRGDVLVNERTKKEKNEERRRTKKKYNIIIITLVQKTSRWHDVVWFDGALNAAVWCADDGIVVLQRCSVAALQCCSAANNTNV